MKMGILFFVCCLKKGLVDLLRVTNSSSAVNSTTTLDFRASGLSGSGLVFTCCESGPDGGLHLEFGSGLRACCASSGIRSNSGLALGSAGTVCQL
jgi:hypothetical protein